MEKKNNLIFVYGTLKSGHCRHYLLRDSKFKGEYVAWGYKLLDAGEFPVMIKGDGVVYGELYEVDEDVMEVLDYIETGYHTTELPNGALAYVMSSGSVERYLPVLKTEIEKTYEWSIAHEKRNSVSICSGN